MNRGLNYIVNTPLPIFLTFIIVDSNNDDNGDELLLVTSLTYENDGRRPKPGCVTIRFSGSQKDK